MARGRVRQEKRLFVRPEGAVAAPRTPCPCGGRRSPARGLASGGLAGVVRTSATADVDPRTRRRAARPIAPRQPVVLSPIFASSAVIRARPDRAAPAPVRDSRPMADRFADDRDLVGLKLALLGAVLVVTACLR